MSVLIALTLLVALSLCSAYVVAERSDRVYLIGLSALAWAILAPATAFIDASMPFTGGGDDEGYYELAAIPVSGLAEVFDLARFAGLMEQPGYPWLLSLFGFIAGPTLLTLKLLNVLFLVLLAQTWYRIGLLLCEQRFARGMAAVIVLLTPLWFYVFFLLKDLSITLLQSLFLLLAIQAWIRVSAGTLVGLLATAVPLLMLRTPLLIQDSAVLVVALVLKPLGHGAGTRSLIPLALVSVFLLATAPIFTDADAIALLGITSETRILASSTMLEVAAAVGESSELNRSLFPILYFLSETNGLNSSAWAELNPPSLRGLLALPWIFLVVPFFFAGLLWLTGATAGTAPAGLLERIRRSRVLATPWAVVALFIASSALISFIIGETTRWRLPDMPAIAAVAFAGLLYASNLLRKIVSGALALVIALLCIKYLVGAILLPLIAMI
jgi:hypothetical protein